MSRSLRRIDRVFSLLVISAGLVAAAVVASAATGPVQRIQHPVGWDRIVRKTLPGPTRLASGGVLVPKELGHVMVEDGDFTVVDDPVESTEGSIRGPKGTRLQSVGANVRTNNTAGDAAGTTNAETAIAALGNQLVSGWNDGKNFGVSPGNSGYSYSSDGGINWTDGGVPPAVSPARYEGDPSLTVDNAGNFYYANLYTPDGNLSGLSVNRGTFAGTIFTWNNPVMPVAPTGTDFLDKEWISCNPVNGYVYLVYTRFLAAGGSEIEFTRSTNQGVTWDPPTVISDPTTEDCTGSRVAVGPTGEVQVVYYVYDFATQNNYIRARRSTNQGVTFGPEVTLPTGPSGIISNYGSGPAGFNRARGIGFPGLAIDRTGGIHNGRVYATWEETVNFYYDPLGTGGNVAEVEGNDTPGSANAITIGQAITGTMSSTADQDWFSFNGVAGQTVIIYLVPGAGDGFLRLFAGGGGATANRTQLSYIGFGTGLCVYTIPKNGIYYFRVLANSTTVGTYTVYTGLDGPDPGDEIGRDTRDVVMQYSDDGTTWSARKIVNDDAPLFDDAFPEVAVDGVGDAVVYWMDHRNDSNGILQDYYYNFSGTGGLSFTASAKVNDGPSVNWSLVSSNLAPNMGDYEGITADGCNVYANFADGRGGTPDSWMAPINECGSVATDLSLVGIQALADRVHLDWYSSDAVGLTANVYRRGTLTDWTLIGHVTADGTGRFQYDDASITGGTRYGYRLGLPDRNGESYSSEAWVDVPEMSLQLAAMKNPTVHDMQVSFALPNASRATLQLIDVSGRVVASREVGTLGAGSHTARLGDGSLASGVYLVRLTQGSQILTCKSTFIR